jgi:glycerol-3-phosphate dehydrogenase
VHLVFDANRIPVPGALVMAHPDDGRISFVIPRPDYGSGVVIVGTTDGPTPHDPEKAEITSLDIDYLLKLLGRFFPSLKLSQSDILSAYIGVRPLMAPPSGEGASLQKISREHHIDEGPGGAVLVAGGKYTTHRTMALEIVDFAASRNVTLGQKCKRVFSTETPINLRSTSEAVERAKVHPKASSVEPELRDRYGAEALEILQLEQEHPATLESPAGFPRIEAQLRFGIRHGMVLELEDFYLRRIPLFLSRADHGLPWLDALARVWGEETRRSPEDCERQKARLLSEFQRRNSWRSCATG